MSSPGGPGVGEEDFLWGEGDRWGEETLRELGEDWGDLGAATLTGMRCSTGGEDGGEEEGLKVL